MFEHAWLSLHLNGKLAEDNFLGSFFYSSFSQAEFCSKVVWGYLDFWLHLSLACDMLLSSLDVWNFFFHMVEIQWQPGLCFSFYNSTFLKTEGSLSVYKISSSLFSEEFSAVVYLNCFSVPFGFLLLRNLFCLCWILFCTVPFLRFSSTVLSSFYFPLHLLWFSQACLLCQNFNFQLVIVHSLLIDLMS